MATSSGGGTITINRTGDVTGATDGISGTSTGGTVAVTTGGNVTGTAGSSINIGTGTTTGNIIVGAGHTVMGGTSAISSAAGTATVTNAGSLNAAGTAASVFTATGGMFTLDNSNMAFGAIQSSGASVSTTFNNLTGGVWNLTSSTSTLDGANDTIVNDGNIIATGIVNFVGLETFTNNSLNTFTVNGTTTIGPMVAFANTGRISMQDGAIVDTLNINGSFTASGSSTLDVDIDLTKNNTGGVQLSDILVLRGGATSGATTVNFTQIVNGKPPTLQDTPIIVVDVDAAQANTGTFVDTNGTLPSAGRIIEYTFVQAANGDWVVVSSLNTAVIGSVSGSIQSTLAVIGAVVNRPSSPVCGLSDCARC